MKNKQNLMTVVFIIVGIFIFGGGFILLNQSKSSTLNNIQNISVTYKPNSSVNFSLTNSSLTNQISYKYKDGEYAINADYLDPDNNTEKMTVTISLNEDSIIEVSNSYPNAGRESKRYQATFERQIKNKILNKKIDNIDSSIIAGASLTSEAFNIALSKIKTSAKL